MTTATKPAGTTPLGEFLERYPWPAEWLQKGKPMDFLWTFDLPVSVEKLWPYLADLSSFNRRIGFAEMRFTEKNGRMQGVSMNGGTRMAWEEVPWEWEYGREFSHARVYSEGLGHVMRARYLFQATGQGQCRLTVYFGWVPRGLKGRLYLSIGMKQIHKAYHRALGEITRALQRRETLPPVEAPVKLTETALERLKGIRRGLVEAGVKPGVADKLVHYAQTTPDEDIYRIRVKPLAREWKVGERELLLAFLTATRKGLFQLTWDVLCPHCRGVRNEAGSLDGVPRKGTCEACRIDFDATALNALEVTFHVHPSLRQVRKKLYCAAEPAAKAHIKLAKTLPARNRLSLETLLSPGRYRLRIHGRKAYNLLDIEEGSGDREVRWPDSLAEGRLNGIHFPRLLLENTSAEPQTFVLEEDRLDQDALRPVDLFSLQGFRDLFSQEALSSDIQLEIGVQTLLFTDLVGSTRFYEVEGDTVAFTEVKEHFTRAYGAVKENDGAVVKTIGDAVMAAFAHPADALRAAVELQRFFREGNPQTRLRLRVTLNTGSCLAVNLDSLIDYFGNTVNLAAKIQAVAGAGQIAFTQAVLDDPEVGKLLKDEGLAVEKLDFEMKWAKRTIPVYRVEVK